MSDVTQILSQIESGDPLAAGQLLPLVYEELRKLAAAKLAHEKPGQTLQATALVHEAFIRLVDVRKVQHWDSRGPFFAAATVMQRILVERARRKNRVRHGGGHCLRHSLAAQRAVETLPRDAAGKLLARPEIRTDNGSGYVSREFREVLAAHELTHQRIKPHCPEENGLMERAYRTLREALEGQGLPDRPAAERVLQRVISCYNHERLHRALGYLRPVDYYRGDPAALTEARCRKLAAARHQRKEANLRLRQRTLPLYT